MDSLPHTSWQTVVVLAVHPDDESLAAGGLIQHALARGADVRVIIVTDGDNNPWPQRFIERRWRIDAADRQRWGARRRAEALSALACLGVSADAVSFWGYPDQGLTDCLLSGGEELIAQLAATLSELQPTMLVAPSMLDLHPDHSALAVLLRFALARSDDYHAGRLMHLEYLVHAPRGLALPEDLELRLAENEVDRKRQAVLSHVTQMALSRRRFLRLVKTTEVFAIADSSSDRPDPAEGVVDGVLAGDGLRLKVKDLASVDALFVAAETDAGSIRLTVAFKHGKAIAHAGPDRLRVEVNVVRQRDHDEILLPAATFASAKNIFVKLAGGWGFFDRNGWCELSLDCDPTTEQGARKTRGAETRSCCIIPCYNIAGVCGSVVREAAQFADVVIAVNDGSTDDTERVLKDVQVECGPRVHVLSFSENRGKGVALLEAFRFAELTIPFDVLVTLDGDGQHRPEDIPRMVRTAAEGNYSLVIGERLEREKMPLRSRLGNTLTALLMKFLYPAAPIDTQSGLRAFDREFLRDVVERIKGGRYETELEILLLALRERRRIGSVPIPTVYLDGNRLSHFRPIVDSGRIYSALFRSRFPWANARAAARAETVQPTLGPSPALGVFLRGGSSFSGKRSR